MNTIEKLREACEPIGIKARSFAVDYRDDRGKDYNRESFTVGNYGNDFIISGLINEYKTQGFEVSAIHEILDGYSLEELERLARQDVTESMKHLKLLYLNQKLMDGARGNTL